MKKLTIVLICISMLLLCACGSEKAPEPTPTPAPVVTAEPVATPEPVVTPEPTPTTEEARVKTLYGYCCIREGVRGDAVEVLETAKGLDGWYIVRYGDKVGLMDKQFVRLDSETAPDYGTAYTESATKIFSSYFVNDKETETFDFNTQVNVLEKFDICTLVEHEGKLAYVMNSALTSGYRGDYSYDPWSGTGGGYDPTPSYGSDGEDIIITMGAAQAEKAKLVLLGYEVENAPETSVGMGKILADRAPLLAALYDYNDTVKVLSRGADTSTVYIYGEEAQMQNRFLLFSNEKAYEGKDMYARSGAKLFKYIRLLGDPIATLSENTPVRVLNEFEESWLVEANGIRGYVDPDMLSENKIYYDYAPFEPYDVPAETWTPPEK